MNLIEKGIKDLGSLGGFVFTSGVGLVALILGKFNIFWKLLIGLGFATLVVIIIRSLYFKPRPQPMEYVGYIQKIAASSFPSLHTARALIVALIFVRIMGNTLFTIFIISAALSVAYSRIYLKRHDLIDVLGGIGLGLLGFFLTLLI